MKHVLFAFFSAIFLSFSGYSQVQFWGENFESTGPQMGGGTRSATYNSGWPSAPYTRYFKQTSLADISDISPFFQGVEGTLCWAAEDVDGAFDGVSGGMSPEQSVQWSGINISGKTGLSFTGMFATTLSTVWDHQTSATDIPDYIAVQYQLNGTGAWVTFLAFQPNVAGATNGALAVDANLDGTGDGTALTNTLTDFSGTIPVTGTTINIRCILSVNAQNEEIAFDNFRLFETPSCTTPSITGNPSNRSICVNGNTTFSGAATGATAYKWQVDPGSGFVDIANGGVYSNATTTTLSITGATATMNGYKYRLVAINGVASCFANSNFGTLNISNMTSSTAKNDVLCFGQSTGSAAVSAPMGGIGSVTYSWSPSGGTSSIATGLAAGTYICTITDAISCQITKSITINQPAAALSAASGGGKTDVSCNSGSNGTATVAPTGGTTPYTYSWAPSGGTNATATGLAAGTYTVTVTDFNNCQATRSFTINQPASALSAASGGGKTDVSCNSGSNGTATVAPTGGTPGYTYSWAPSGGTSATATGLAAGAYTVTVTDANACQTSRNFTINQPTALNAALGGGKTDVSCNSGSNGTATVAPTGGTPGYTYSWAPSGGTNATATGLAAGTYTVTVTDANTCQTTRSFTINQPTAALDASAGSQTDVSCNNGSNGTATVSPTGGTPGYTYSWAPSGGTAATATGLAAGTYTVTVTDANACQDSKTFTINQPTTSLDASAGSQTDVSCNSGSNGTATVSPTGGTPGYTYSWAPSGGTAATATGLAAGTYTVTVTDANACQDSKTFTINQPATALDASAGSQTDVSCNGGTNGTATVAPTGGTPGYTYSWAPTGGASATATGLAAGTYTVTVTDANACQDSKTFTINQPATALDASAGSQTDVSCNNGANGTATVAPTGGTPGYTYSWAPSGGTNATATGLTAGTYTVTVTDANTCQETRTFTVSEPTALDASAGSQTDISCNGGSNGTATVSPTGGTPGYTYSWAPSGGTSATATGLAAGTYTVTVTDANACQDSKTFTINEPTTSVDASAGSQTDVSCNGGSNGTATVAPTGGTPGYTYSWAPSGGTAATATGLAAGTYTVTVTDANACQDSKTFTINEPTTSVDASAGSQTDVSCNGGTNGTATVSPTGGTPGYTYSWAPTGGTAATATGLAAGTYTVTVTDANNCSDTKTFTITEPAALDLTTGGATTDASCNSGANGTATVAPTGGTPGYTYSWAPTGGTNATAIGLSAGTYTVTVTDANACQETRTFTVSEPTALDASAGSQTDVSCNGGANGTATVAPTGGTPGYTYSWAPSGGTAATATGLAAGTYTVTVTDANNCEDTQTFTITEPTVLDASAGSQTDVSCNGGANGTATVTPTGGTPGYTYSWAPSGGAAATATGLAAGTYTVTVTDANNCEDTQTFTITEPTVLDASNGSQTDLLCNGGSNGTATVSPTGGTPGYTYSWAPTGGTAATATGLAAGTYTVTVTDANNCSDTKSFTITEPAALDLTTGGGTTDASCNSGANGTATVAPTGGTPGYTYSWAPSGGTNATATGLSAGTYTVTVTDANACQETRTFTVSEPTALDASAGSQTDISCNGGSNGTATVSPTGGTPGYTYSWAPSGGTAATATGLAAGTYTVTVTDANNCEDTQTFTITEPTVLDASAGSQTDVLCNGGSTGTATVAPTGGTPGYTYSWAPSGGAAATATGLAAGTYTVTVTDANNCEDTQTFTITEPTVLDASNGSQTDLLCNGGSNGTATVAPTGGTPGYTYSWAPTGGTNATATGLAAGTYTVTVTDANNCSDTKSFTITEPAALDLTTGGGTTDASCNSGANGTATVAPTGGTPGYTYSWAPTGGTNATAIGLSAGTYTVTVTDANACQETRTFTVSEPTALDASAGSQTDISCNGGANGTATVAPTGGTPGYTYSWAPSGGTAATATGLAAGTYTVTVTDANNCEDTQTFTITEPTVLDASAGSQTDVLCNGGSTGTATVAPTGGTPGYTYSWAPTGGAAATATGLTAGTYTVTVTDANNCSDTKTFTITESAPITSSFSHTACGSYSWGTQTHTTSGVYTQVFTAANTCDSVVTLNLTIIPPVTNTVSETSCSSYTWAQNGMTYTASGLYVDTIPAAGGCDSIVTLDLTINQPSSSSSSEFACGSYTWIQNGMTYTASGAYTDTIQNASGCDSIITLNLTIGGSSASESVTVCEQYTWAQNGMTYTSSGMYSDTLTDVNGCDSILILNLTVIGNPVATIINNGDGTYTASSGATYQWLDCTTNTEISGATSQTFAPAVNGTYAVIVENSNGCEDTSSCVVVDDLGLTDLDPKTVQVFPNPTEGQVTITMLFTQAKLVITDVQGKTHYVGQISSGQLVDLTQYEDGVYFLSIETETGKVLKRIVKQ